MLFRVCFGWMGNVHVWVCLRKRMKKQIPCGARIAYMMPKNILSLTITTVTLTGNYEFAFVRLHRRSQLHIGVDSTAQTQLTADWAEPLAALIPLCWCWHKPAVAKPASQESPIFELFTLTPLQCGLAESGTDYQTEEIQTLDCHTNTPCTAVGNMSLKSTETTVFLSTITVITTPQKSPYEILFMNTFAFIR